MKGKVVLTAAEAALEGQTSLGGKAMGLVALQEAGLAVPPFFVVTARGFEEHLDGDERRDRLARILKGLADVDVTTPEGRRSVAEASKQARALVESGPPSPGLRDALANALHTLGEGPYAVRSSMIGEDSAAHSYAGLLESHLFQRDAGDVEAALLRCWSSAFTERALAYQARRTTTGSAIPAVAVVVQRMIDGDVSGVAFTAHPTTGRRDHCLVTATWGLGEGLVSGECNADELVLDDQGHVVSRNIADKDRKAVAAPGGGTKLVDVEPAAREAPCLRDDEARAVASAARAIAAARGAPMDVEWTFARGTLYLLQARPITTLPAPETASAPPTATQVAPEPGGRRVVWDNSNIQESYCGVTTPLTFSFARKAYASVYAQTLRTLGVPAKTIESQADMFRSLLGLVNGRVYYNINNWYRALSVFPSFGRNKEDMERMMGLDSPVDFIRDEQLSRVEKLQRAPMLARTAVSLFARFRSLDGDVTAFLEHFEQVVAAVDRASLPTATYGRLIELTEHLWAQLIDRWETPIVNDIFVMMASGKLRRFLTDHFGKEEAEALWVDLVRGEQGIESLEPVRRLLRVAARIRGSGALVATLMAGDATEALANVRAASAEIDADVRDWLERYGDRAMGELKLETRSLREDPGYVARVLRNYVSGPALDPDAMAKSDAEAQERATRVVRERLPATARNKFKRLLDDARRGIRYRENTRLARTRAFGLQRDIYLAMGRRLHEAGRLDAPRDVFYLTVDELRDYYEGTSVTAGLAALVRVRKAEFAAYEKTPPPNHFETIGAVYHGNDLTTPANESMGVQERVLRGTAASPGIVDASLHVVMKPTDDIAIKGRILTTLRTDPGWAPLFPGAAAILVERGSTLSHSAILARELGIPCVVGVRDLLGKVRHGERVRLDGTAGTVERLEVPS